MAKSEDDSPVVAPGEGSGGNPGVCSVCDSSRRPCETLPEGWKCQSSKRKNGRVDYEYLSPELKVLRSRVGVVEYMKAMGGYTKVEMARVLPIRIKKEKIQ